jgi:hypothetical protein
MSGKHVRFSVGYLRSSDTGVLERLSFLLSTFFGKAREPGISTLKVSDLALKNLWRTKLDELFFCFRLYLLSKYSWVCSRQAADLSTGTFAVEMLLEYIH